MQNGLPGNGQMTQQYLDVLTWVRNRHVLFSNSQALSFYMKVWYELRICSGLHQAVICSLAGPDTSDERRERPLKEEKHCLCPVCKAMTKSGRFSSCSHKKGGELQGRDQRGSVVTQAWEYTSFCTTEWNILYPGSNSVGFVHLVVHIDWA